MKLPLFILVNYVWIHLLVKIRLRKRIYLIRNSIASLYKTLPYDQGIKIVCKVELKCYKAVPMGIIKLCAPVIMLDYCSQEKKLQ